MFGTSSNNINAGSVDIAMTENICELGNILFNAVKGAGKQVAQIVWKNLLWIYPRLLTKIFHFPPNVCAAHRSTAAGNEYHSCTYILKFCIVE